MKVEQFLRWESPVARREPGILFGCSSGHLVKPQNLGHERETILLEFWKQFDALFHFSENDSLFSWQQQFTDTLHGILN